MHHSIRNAACAIACLAIAAPTGGVAQKSGAAASATLTRIKQSGRIKLGYQPDARPFSYRDQSGNAAGFSVALCRKVNDQFSSVKFPRVSGCAQARANAVFSRMP